MMTIQTKINLIMMIQKIQIKTILHKHKQIMCKIHQKNKIKEINFSFTSGNVVYVGATPTTRPISPIGEVGNTNDFESFIRWFESNMGNQYASVVQQVGHQTPNLIIRVQILTDVPNNSFNICAVNKCKINISLVWQNRNKLLYRRGEII